jgi:hypothetical protein
VWPSIGTANYRELFDYGTMEFEGGDKEDLAILSEKKVREG